jgi:hypothetical protein
MVNAVENWSFVMWRLFVSPATRALPIFLSPCQIKRIDYCGKTYDLSWNHLTAVETPRGAIAELEALTKNDKRTKGQMSTEK